MQSNHADKFNLSLYQASLHWQKPEANFEQLKSALQYTKEKCDLLVLPEMFTTGFSMNPNGIALNECEGLLDRFFSLCQLTGGAIAGSFIWKEGTEYRNRFLCFNENGVKGFYDKRNLFGLGGECDAYSCGASQELWNIKGWKIKPYVCYDLRFPEWVRNNEEAELILFTANWPAQRVKHWQTLLVARAIENQCYVAGVNRIGVDDNGLVYEGSSVVVDSEGEYILNLGKKEGFGSVSLTKSYLQNSRERFPFLRDRLRELKT
jgi:omega-amidase